MHSYKWPRPSVTVDAVAFGFEVPDALSVLLVTRNDDPFAGMRALPGGFVEVSDSGGQGESLDAAVLRELKEETNVELSHMEQLYTFGAPGRDPRGRVIDVAYLALVRRSEHEPTGGSDASKAEWVPVQEALKSRLAFDHNEILRVGLERLRNKVRYAPIGLELLPREFTLAQMRELYEALLGRKLEVSNFAKQAKATGVLKLTGKTKRNGHRPARLYRFDRKAYEQMTKRGINFEI